MTAQEIIAKIAKYKEAHAAESDPDTKARYAKKIKDLDAELVAAEKEVEKKEEKAVAEEKKELSDADKKLARLKDALAAESDPDLKARYQKKITEIESQIKEVKKEVKEEKKDVAEQKQEIKKAAKEVKSVVKEVRKAAVKKVAQKTTERKEVVKKKAERKAKISKMMSELDKLIENNKFLKEKYKGKGVNLERDAARKAKPFGYRFVGKNDYRVPTKEQIKRGLKRGTIDYEGRPNRSDKFPKGYKGKDHKFEDGGSTEEVAVFVIFEGKDHHNDKPLYQVISKSEDNDYSGEWHENREDAEAELKELEGTYAKGGKVKAGTSHEDGMRTAKPTGLRYKDAALGKVFKNRKITAADLRKHPTKEFADKFPHLVYTEERLTKSDKHPSVKNMSYATGGQAGDRYAAFYVVTAFDSRPEFNKRTEISLPSDKKTADKRLKNMKSKEGYEFLSDFKVEHKPNYAKGGKTKVGHSIQDKHRYAKPAGWRWKEEAVTKRVIVRKQLSNSPNKKMRALHPDLVYFEDRLNKADVKPTRTSADSE